ncbi:transposable element Tcb1 transposase [Trichonephila clavipes]|nr:transposable element Tcb1 transposase [Trichonephila clavipes]
MGDKIIRTPVKKAWPISKTHNAHVSERCSPPPSGFERTPKEAFAPECIVPTVKHVGGSLMVWGAISWRGLGPLVTLHGKVKAAHYVNIVGDQVHPFVQTSFSGECPLYQDDNAPIHTAKIVQEWFAEHEGK